MSRALPPFTTYTLRLLETVHGIPTEHDGRYVKLYDPRRPRLDDLPILETVATAAEAHHFASFADAMRLYRMDSGLRRPDGRPDRPLTAFTVVIEAL